MYLLVLLVTAVLRLHNLPTLGLEHDEVANWLIDRSILDEGNLAVYYTRAYGHEAGFHALQAASVGLIGDNALALRLPAALSGILLVAVSYTLTRKLFGKETAVLVAGLLAVLFWPVFYSRLGLRAITLPLLSSLSAYFWWRAWGLESGVRRLEIKDHPITDDQRSYSPCHRRPEVVFTLSGLFAGLSLYTYMAARAVPIFYGLFIGYLAVVHGAALKKRWRGVLAFVLVMTAVSAPLLIFLKTNPGAEFRISEIDAPLQALKSGDWRPILANGLKILGVFGWRGDPLWRQGVAGQPVFEPVAAVLFYLGVGVSLWRWRDGRYAFILLWLATSTTPSLVTTDAPSSIRIINALPVVAIFPVIGGRFLFSVVFPKVMHNSRRLSTALPHLSTIFGGNRGKTVAALLFFLYLGRTTRDIFVTWPQNEEVQFVWQAALTETAVALDNTPAITAAALAGWSPDTMDSPTMQLSLRREDVALSHFNPADGALILPNDDQPALIRPSALPLDPIWEEKLVGEWGAIVENEGLNTRYTLPAAPPIRPEIPVNVQFGQELELVGVDVGETAVLTYWRVLAPPAAARRLFLHWLDGGGDLLAEDYRLDTLDPQSLWFPHWQVGDLILQAHLRPEGVTAASLRLGVFNPYTCAPGPCQNLLTESGEPFILVSLP